MRTFLIVAALLLAGCSDAPEPEAPDVVIDVQSTPDTGVIRGVVVDDSITPVEGATIALVGPGISTESRDDGAFGFEGLDPGVYFMDITKVGYESIQQSVDVVADEDNPPLVKVLLTRAPGTEPHVLAHQHTGFIACGLQVGNRLIGADVCNVGGVYGEDDADPFFEVTGGSPDYFQSEIIWEHTQEFGKSLTTTQYTCDDVSCDRSIGSSDRFCQIWGPSPLVCKVTPEAGWGNEDGTGGGEGITTSRLGAEEGGGYVVEMRADCSACVPGTALGVGLILEQTYTVYSHSFYNVLPDEGWLFVEDGAP